MTTIRRGPNRLYLGGYLGARELVIHFSASFLVMCRIVSTLKAIIHYGTFHASLPQPKSCGNGRLRKLNMVFSRLDILFRVARMKITASLKFGQKNICSQLKLFTNWLLRSFWRCLLHKFHMKVRITALTKKKFRLQIEGMVGSSLWGRNHAPLCLQFPIFGFYLMLLLR